MKVEVRMRGLQSSSALRDYVMKRIRTQLGRFAHELTHVLVRVGDINGPKGGVDKRCKVTAMGPRIRFTTVEDVSDDPYSAVDLAVGKVGQTLGRGIERVKQMRRSRRQHPWMLPTLGPT